LSTTGHKGNDGRGCRCQEKVFLPKTASLGEKEGTGSKKTWEGEKPRGAVRKIVGEGKRLDGYRTRAGRQKKRRTEAVKKERKNEIRREKQGSRNSASLNRRNGIKRRKSRKEVRAKNSEARNSRIIPFLIIKNSRGKRLK